MQQASEGLLSARHSPHWLFQHLTACCVHNECFAIIQLTHAGSAGNEGEASCTHGGAGSHHASRNSHAVGRVFCECVARIPLHHPAVSHSKSSRDCSEGLIHVWVAQRVFTLCDRVGNDWEVCEDLKSEQVAGWQCMHSRGVNQHMLSCLAKHTCSNALLHSNLSLYHTRLQSTTAWRCCISSPHSSEGS